MCTITCFKTRWIFNIKILAYRVFSFIYWLSCSCQVTGLQEHVSISIMFAVCIFYTAIVNTANNFNEKKWVIAAYFIGWHQSCSVDWHFSIMHNVRSNYNCVDQRNHSRRWSRKRFFAERQLVPHWILQVIFFYRSLNML